LVEKFEGSALSSLLCDIKQVYSLLSFSDPSISCVEGQGWGELDLMISKASGFSLVHFSFYWLHQSISFLIYPSGSSREKDLFLGVGSCEFRAGLKAGKSGRD
jgi:hypothetical protein